MIFPLSWPWQPKHRRDSTQKDGGRAVEGETAPRSLFPALTVLSSDCTFPTVWTTYLNVLLPQTQSVRGKFLFPSNRWLLFLHFSTFPVVVSSIHPPWRLQPWESCIFLTFFVLRAEVPILWPPDAKGQLTGKDPDAGKDWRQKEKGMAEGEMAREHHWLDGHKFEQTLGDNEGQRSLVCCSLWVCRVRHDLATKRQQLIYLFGSAAWHVEY